jgi:hypothetical protein
VVIPDTINGYPVTAIGTAIGSAAFYRCYGLSSVTIPDSVTSIGYKTFFYCTNLTNVTIPDSVTTIGDHAFEYCANLTSAMIGNGVASIGAYAFDACTNLTSIYFRGNAPMVGEFAFYSANTLTIYYLPGTTGWGPVFFGSPTALWTLPYPLILTSGPDFGVQTGGFSFNISWATNLPVVVEACTDLANPTWSQLQTNTLTSGSCYFSDPQWTNYPIRFYRVRSL